MIESKLNYLKKNFAIFYHSYQNVSFRTYVIPNTVQILSTPPILLLCHCQRYLWILQSKAKVLKLFWLNLDNNSKNVREDFFSKSFLTFFCLFQLYVRMPCTPSFWPLDGKYVYGILTDRQRF